MEPTRERDRRKEETVKKLQRNREEEVGELLQSQLLLAELVCEVKKIGEVFGGKGMRAAKQEARV